MIKITNLRVKNFKSLLDTEVAEFSDVNMFYGFNNSGKSNIFRFLELLFTKKKAIEVVSYDVGEETDDQTLVQSLDFWDGHIFDKPFIFSNNNKTNNIIFEISLDVSNDLISESELLKENGFITGGDTASIILKGKIESEKARPHLIIEEALLNEKQFYIVEDGISYGFRDIAEEGLNLDFAENILRIFNDCVEFIDTERNFQKEILTNLPVHTLTHTNFKNWLFDLFMNSEKNEIFKGLARFLQGFDFSSESKKKLGSNADSFPFRDMNDIGFTKFGDEIEIMLKNDKVMLPLSSFGTGIQQFFYILSRIFMNDSRIIIIEEVELNLSPLYQKEIMIFIKELLGNKFDQLLFSSHSPFFTLKDNNLVDVVQHIQIGTLGTKVESHSEWSHIDNDSYFSFLYS